MKSIVQNSIKISALFAAQLVRRNLNYTPNICPNMISPKSVPTFSACLF